MVAPASENSISIESPAIGTTSQIQGGLMFAHGSPVEVQNMVRSHQRSWADAWWKSRELDSNDRLKRLTVDSSSESDPESFALTL